MKAYTVEQGIVAPLDRANVDTDLIIPKQFLKSIKRTGFGENLFDELRYLDEGYLGQDNSKRPLNPDFELNKPRYQGASILISRANFGCGSSREHAPWALNEYGFRTVIAPSYADIFFNNSFKNGMLPVILSEEIVDQAWFPLDWKKDPTISSMLEMLDAIQVEFADTQGIWDRLKNNAITFYFLPIKDMGLTDELYIKMNSRGKPLTQFEHFKAELERELRKIDEPTAKRIIKKIDLDWTDMIWRYRGNDNVIDDEFLRYFKFICDIICYQNGGTTQGKSNDEFDLLKEYFSGQNKNVLANIQTLEEYFDCWSKLNGDNTPDKFLERNISHDHQAGKIKIEKRYAVNIFNDCVRTYGDITGNGNRVFPLNRIVLLYAVISYLLNKDTITDSDFSRRLRIVNNLIQNSEDEISDSEFRTSGNRMPAILKQVDAIIRTGKIDDSIEKNLNLNQLAEEAIKITWVENNPDKAEDLFEL